MTAESLGRRSLAVDAVYCAAAATVDIAGARPLGRVLGVPARVPVAAGIVTLPWAETVRRLAGASRWREAVTAVAAANGVAAVSLVILASQQRRRPGRLLLGAIAVEVAAFALTQAAALKPER